MQYPPTQEELLLAIADFIEADVRPQLQDRALSFRCLIAANLARMCVLERRMEEWHDGGELAGLRALLDSSDLPADDPTTRDDRTALLERLNAELAGRIRAGDLEPTQLAATRAHLRRTLKGRLAITNPRFDTDAGWEIS